MSGELYRKPEARTTPARKLTACLSYLVATACHCLSRLTHRSTTLRRLYASRSNVDLRLCLWARQSRRSLRSGIERGMPDGRSRMRHLL